MQCKILLFQGLGANLFFEDDLCQFDNEEIDLSKDVCVCFVLPETFVFYWEDEIMTSTLIKMGLN